MDAYLRAAIEEAQLGLAEGGIPIGSVLVHDSRFIEAHPELWNEDIGE